MNLNSSTQVIVTTLWSDRNRFKLGFNTATWNFFKLLYIFTNQISIFLLFCFFLVFQEEDADCGGVSSLSPSLGLMVVIQVVLLWVVNDSRYYTIPSWPQKNMIQVYMFAPSWSTTWLPQIELPPKGNGKRRLKRKWRKKDRISFTFRVFSKCLHLFDVEESFVYQRRKDDLKTDYTYDYPSFLPLKQLLILITNVWT